MDWIEYWRVVDSFANMESCGIWTTRADIDEDWLTEDTVWQPIPIYLEGAL